MGFDTGDQFTRREGLGHIIVSAQSQSADLVHIVLFGRYNDNRNVLLLSYLFADFKSVHLRKHQVQYIEVEVFP